MGRDTSEATEPPFAALGEDRRREAMARLAVLRPALEGAVPLTRVAAKAGVPLRTAQRWLARYRRDGMQALACPIRRDAGRRRLRPELVALVEGLGLRRPRRSAAAIRRRAVEVARAKGWPVPFYAAVHAILAALDPAMVTLAQEGPAAFRDRFELVHRQRAEAPNALWQADHTLLDVLILDHKGKPARPWLTPVIDDRSRAVVGTMTFLGAPSALNTSLAQAGPRLGSLRHPRRPSHVDHGPDFTSAHLEQVAAALRIRLVHTAVARPQGRGKVERLFGTITTELLPELPGHLASGRPASPPRLSLAELDRASAPSSSASTTRALIPGPARSLSTPGLRAASCRACPRAWRNSTSCWSCTPSRAWCEPRRHPLRGPALREPDAGRLCRRARHHPLRPARPLGDSGVPTRPVPAPRDQRGARGRDGHAEGHRGRAGHAHRLALRAGIGERIARVADCLPGPGGPVQATAPPDQPSRARIRLHLYEEDD